jgi:tRNA dimethylallyltransferase
MIEAGALTEVAALEELALDPGLPAMKALGVRPLARHRAGQLSLDEAVALAQRDTRRYAKRQLTWLRHQAADWPTITAQDSKRFFAENFPIIRQF